MFVSLPIFINNIQKGIQYTTFIDARQTTNILIHSILYTPLETS